MQLSLRWINIIQIVCITYTEWEIQSYDIKSHISFHVRFATCATPHRWEVKSYLPVARASHSNWLANGQCICTPVTSATMKFIVACQLIHGLLTHTLCRCEPIRSKVQMSNAYSQLRYHSGSGLFASTAYARMITSVSKYYDSAAKIVTKYTTFWPYNLLQVRRLKCYDFGVRNYYVAFQLLNENRSVVVILLHSVTLIWLRKKKYLSNEDKLTDGDKYSSSPIDRASIRINAHNRHDFIFVFVSPDTQSQRVYFVIG